MEEKSFSLADVLALFGFAGFMFWLFYFAGPLGQVFKDFPVSSGFCKVAILATFGEYLKTRIMTGEWRVRFPLKRFLVWGCYGAWFTFAFPLFSGGVEYLISVGLWPDWSYTIREQNLWLAFSKSLWINIFGGFAYFMMLSHEYFNYAIVRRSMPPMTQFFQHLDFEVWGKIIPASIIIFWLPAHTITFMLPGHWRVMSAALLSIVLGFILTVRARME